MGEQKNVQEPDINQLRKVRREKLADLQENGKNPFIITKYDVTCHAMDIKDNYEEMEGKQVCLAGRIMQKRVMGKASFCNILDQSGNIQSYVARDSIGEEAYKDFKKMDIGDIVGLEGEVFKTKTGEISVHASAVRLLSKSLQILPEKFHGLTNTDMRYRQRYVDLIPYSFYLIAFFLKLFDRLPDSRPGYGKSITQLLTRNILSSLLQ